MNREDAMSSEEFFACKYEHTSAASPCEIGKLCVTRCFDAKRWNDNGFDELYEMRYSIRVTSHTAVVSSRTPLVGSLMRLDGDGYSHNNRKVS